MPTWTSTDCSIWFDDSPVILFLSVGRLIVYFELISAIPVVLTGSKKDRKHSEVNGLAFPRGGGKMSA